MAQIYNPALLELARRGLQKRAFVDPAAVAASDPAAGGDPMAAAGGGDPMAAAGGAPPMGPPMGGMDPMMESRLAAIEQQLAAGGGAGAGGEKIKPKIDVNVALMQIQKMLAKITDAMGIQVPAAEMVATPDDLTSMAANDSSAVSQDPAAAAGGASAIAPIEPMQAAAPAAMGGDKQAADQVRPSGYAGRGINPEAVYKDQPAVKKSAVGLVGHLR